MIYDVVVVGAGPAGSMAAKTAAENGLNVLLVEKRQEIGVPVRCAGAVPSTDIEKFTAIDKRWVTAEVKWLKIYYPDGTEVVENWEEYGVGLILERKLFDRHLAKLAVNAGVNIYIKTTAIGLERETDGTVNVLLKRCGEEFSVKAKIVVGADGIESRVGKWAGLDTTLKPDEIGSAIQYLLTGIDFDPEGSYFWFGKDIAPGGYAWLFPRGKKEANVGLGVVPAVAKKSAKEYLDSFIEENFKNGKIIEVIAGGIPIKGQIETAVSDNVMLAGDAASHPDPLTGGGIVNAMKAGYYAGKVAAEAVKKEDYSKEFLKKYDQLWKDDFGRMLEYRKKQYQELMEVLLNY